MRQRRPVAYQEVDGARREVAARYVVNARGLVSFAIGDYDKRRPLVIDPILIYSSYLGGINQDRGQAVAVDASGNAYVAGLTGSSSFPHTAGVFQDAKGGQNDAYMAKHNPAGSSLLFSGYIGGSGSEQGNGVAIDTAAAAYIVGNTSSFNFPVANALRGTYGGSGDAFIAKVGTSIELGVTMTDSPDHDFAGWQFWLTKLNQFGGNFVQAEMVKAFITSTEYKQRFGQ